MTEDATLSYSELERDAGRLAGELGAEPRACLPTTLPAGIELAVLLHAAARLGAALVPHNPALPAPATPSLPLPEGTLVVLHTSGTTGAPRPVPLTRTNFEASARAAAAHLPIDPADRWLCCLPAFHVGGLSILTRSAIHATTALLEPRFDAQRVTTLLEAGEASIVSLVPTMLARLHEAGLERAPGLRAVLLGGGPIPADLLDWAQATGLPVMPTYGMTETTSQIATAAPGERAGRPLPGVEVRIADEGEILVRGPMVATSALAADGWLHTGDAGRLDEAGLLHVEGRIKELIVTGGENVAPLEVEQALLAHPAVADAGVAGVADREWGEAVTAFVVLSAAADPDELRDWCRERLAPFKVPKRVVVRDELPRNAAGKLLRSRLA